MHIVWTDTLHDHRTRTTFAAVAIALTVGAGSFVAVQELTGDSPTLPALSAPTLDEPADLAPSPGSALLDGPAAFDRALTDAVTALGTPTPASASALLDGPAAFDRALTEALAAAGVG